MTNRLSGLCNGCIAFYSTPIFQNLSPLLIIQLSESAATIPREFTRNPRILELLNNQTSSSSSTLGVVEGLSPTANSILASAVIHQENASTSRIGVQVRKGAGLPRFKGLSSLKSVGGDTFSITAERKAKKADWVQQQSTIGPKFSIALWKSRGIEDKPKQV